MPSDGEAKSRDEDTCSSPGESSLAVAAKGENPPVPPALSDPPSVSRENKVKQLQPELSKSPAASIADNLPGMLPASTDPPSISGECQKAKLHAELAKSPAASAGGDLPGALPKSTGDSAGNKKAVPSATSSTAVSAATVATPPEGTVSKPGANTQKPKADPAVVKGAENLPGVLPKSSDDAVSNGKAAASAASLDAAGLQGLACNSSKPGGNTQKPEAHAAVAVGSENAVASEASSAGVSVGIVAPKAQGLAARRGMAAVTAPAIVAKSKSKEATAARVQSIVRIPDGHIEERYVIGEEVMPSVHKGMQVLFAKRRQDSLEVVIKKRCKEQSFARIREEMDWRANMELMLNLPKSENVCQLYEVLEDPKAYYVVMEKVEGDDLCDAIDDAGQIPIPKCKIIVRQLLTSLDHLHTKGVIHKDLKLENVMMDESPKTARAMKAKYGVEQPVVKLVDFDTVMEWSPRSPKSPYVMGTDQYIAPEAYGGNYSPASDMFAVGVIAYRLLTGTFPYDDSIFDGKPGENAVTHKKMEQIRKQVMDYDVNFSYIVFENCPEAKDLVMGLLTSDENNRLDADAALKHPWFGHE
eukprot:gnl/TRDRNA2_/TRDRNA2_175751_c3_seq25.p1 gnl/TRDRNA2_/TRDRNA2_175751_c3~~gnl/TRDRNA2_/TRDRNA2_175751_c3_seq25.p1  ORF type:complete len:645 (-),score=136.64 gnl/TRDRNA2_/TRDRNA2_175751_c3_seq25:319-2073(-)